MSIGTGFWIRGIPVVLFGMVISSAHASDWWFEQENCSVGFPVFRQIDYDADIQPIFDANCVSCHQPGTPTFEQVGLDLRAGESYWNLMGQVSAQIGRYLVHPWTGGPLLFSKLVCEEPEVGERMPKGQPRLEQSDLSQLFTWRRLGSMPGVEDRRSIGARPELAGTWFDPDAPGQGMSIELIPREPFTRALVYWFTFTDVADDGETSQRWYLADGFLGPFDFQARALLSIYTASGGALNRPEPEASIERVGTAVIKFLSCTEANFAYHLDPEEEGQEARTGKISLERLSPDANCEDEDAGW